VEGPRVGVIAPFRHVWSRSTFPARSPCGRTTWMTYPASISIVLPSRSRSSNDSSRSMPGLRYCSLSHLAYR
jgi:hypothetical protein